MKSSTCRDNSGNAMSLDHEVLEARISLRVAELRVLAVETFARHTPGCLPAGAPSRRPQPDDQPRVHHGSGGDGFLA
jgi:hypothetical protein